MRPNTLLLFQLLLSIFALYSMLANIINYHTIVPLFCMVAMFFVGRYEGEKRQKFSEPAHDQGKELATAQVRRDLFRRWSNSLSHRIWVVKPLAILTCSHNVKTTPTVLCPVWTCIYNALILFFCNWDSRSCQSQEKIQKLTKNHKILGQGQKQPHLFSQDTHILCFWGNNAGMRDYCLESSKIKVLKMLDLQTKSAIDSDNL